MKLSLIIITLMCFIQTIPAQDKKPLESSVAMYNQMVDEVSRLETELEELQRSSSASHRVMTNAYSRLEGANEQLKKLTKELGKKKRAFESTYNEAVKKGKETEMELVKVKAALESAEAAIEVGKRQLEEAENYIGELLERSNTRRKSVMKNSNHIEFSGGINPFSPGFDGNMSGIDEILFSLCYIPALDEEIRSNKKKANVIIKEYGEGRYSGFEIILLLNDQGDMYESKATAKYSLKKNEFENNTYYEVYVNYGEGDFLIGRFKTK